MRATILNAAARPFTVRLVNALEKRCGADGPENVTGRSIVEFYDRSFDFERDKDGAILGQFVSSYFVSTFMETEHGLALDGGVSAWTLYYEDVAMVKALLKNWGVA